MDPTFDSLLRDSLECSEAFIQRAKDLQITTVEVLLDVVLDPEHNGEPDIGDLLRMFHSEEEDDIDLSKGSHPFKDELIAVFQFGKIVKKPWNSLKSGESFNLQEHFNPNSFHAKPKKHTNCLNLAFEHFG